MKGAPPVRPSEPARRRGLPPVVGPGARLLVLGSFPGAASLAARQYYAHPRNHFWPLMAAIWGVPLDAWPYAQRLHELQRRGVALWDVYASCRREGSLDAAIRDAELVRFERIRRAAPGLVAVVHNGTESARASAAVAQALGIVPQRLPSTSPANARGGLAAKCAAWRAAFEVAGVA
jgi:hypoxanthine-DNA glycosylase